MAKPERQLLDLYQQYRPATPPAAHSGGELPSIVEQLRWKRREDEEMFLVSLIAVDQPL